MARIDYFAFTWTLVTGVWSAWEVVMLVLVVGVIVVVGLALAAITFGLARWAACRSDRRS